MTKLIAKIVILLAVLGGIAHYMMILTTGQSPLSSINFSLPEFSLDTVSEKVDTVKDGIQSVAPDDDAAGEKQTVYKWVDANGVTRYSSDPPPDGRESSTLELDPDTNIVQSFKAPTPPAKEKPAAQQETEPAPTAPPNAHKLIEDAEDVQQKLNQRYEELENL